MASVAQEIELLERVLFRLGTTDTDEQLQNTVVKFLAPVLLKITSPNEIVRCKVMEILTHLNKRLKSRPLVQLPVEALLEQYQSTESSFLQNFSIIYIGMGFPRLTIEKQTELATRILNCLEGKPENHQDKLLMLVLPLLGSIKISEDSAGRKILLGLQISTKKKLIDLLQDIFLLPYGVTRDGDVPPGMCPYSFKRVIANNYKAEELENLKQGLCRFVCAGAFSDAESLTMLVLASADTRFSVATPAIAELNKMNSSLNWTEPNLLAPCYTLFLGNGSKNLEKKTSPCSARVRQKLLQYLLKSRGKGINTVRGIQIIFESLFGEGTNQKCKVLALQFAENLVKDGAKELIDKISKVILSGVMKLIGTTSTEPFDIQNAAYGVIAQLGRVCPDIMNKDLQLISTFFDHLCVAPNELHTSIREALVSCAPAFSWNYNKTANTIQSQTNDVDMIDITEQKIKFTPNANQNLLLAMLAQHVESKMQIVQNVAVVYLTTCYPEYFVPARYLLLILAGEERSLLSETIWTYLYGASKKDHINYAYITSIDQINMNSPSDSASSSSSTTQRLDFNHLSTEQRRICLPSFKEMVNYVNEQTMKRAQNTANIHVYGQVTLAYSYEAYTEILEYLRLCLWYSAGTKNSPPGDSKSTYLLKKFINQNYLVSEIIEETENNEIHKYLKLIKKIVYSKRGRIELSCMYDLLDGAPNLLAPICVDLLDCFTLGLKDVSEGTRVLVAQIQGILLANGSVSLSSLSLSTNQHDFNVAIKEILVTLPQKSLEHRHGCILTIGHAFQRKIQQMKLSNGYEIEKIMIWDELKQAVLTLVNLLDEQQQLLISAAIKGLSLIGSVTALPLPLSAEQNAADEDGKTSSTIKPETQTKEHVSKTITRLLKSAHSRPKIREEAASCLGLLAIGDGEFFTARNLKLFTEFLKLTKDTTLIIAIAQGIIYTILGHDDIHDDGDDDSNTVSSGDIDDGHKSTDIAMEEQIINKFCTDLMLTEFLNTLITASADPHPCSRISTSIWLLALVKNLSKHPCIYKRKQILQYAFTELLSDDSEFVQDVASRGLGLVFSLSDPNSQTDLANSLLDQLIGGRRQVNQVNEDSKIFEEGVLGKTPTGGNITTYKELCSLASDMNQPEMIYQFMQLANHNAAWNSKLGAAFGLKSISKKAKVEMQPYLGKIVPRLYRYKYDPTPKIQNSMISIWDSIVSDSKDTVEKYYWDILDELTTNLTHVEWRVRIACCLAVRDLIKRPTGLKLKYESNNASMEVDSVDILEPELTKLWAQLFRVMDDVHEGTRLAAEGTAKALSKICVVAAASNGGKCGKIVASSILPLILETGVVHPVPEIRNISMKTLSELIESSGSILTSHLANLVPCLLKATGELEVPKLSYLSTRLGAQAEAQEAVDSVRAEAAKQHRSMETLTKCVRHIDYDALEKMTPTIVELMRSTVNLGTKIACAHFICLLTLRFNQEMTPIVGKFLGACLSGLKDRNNIVRKYNAGAIGHLCGVAKEQSIIRLFEKLSEYYYEDQTNKGVPLAILAINKRYQDILKDHSSHVLPLIFFAMHEEVTNDSQGTIELWKELWLDVSPGDAGIRLNLNSIIPILEKSLNDQSWLIKTQSANSINTLATRLNDLLGTNEREQLISCLLKNVSGRTFQGKERLLQALAALCKDVTKNGGGGGNGTGVVAAAANDISTNNNSYQLIIDAVMKECRKEEPIYRTHALKSIGDILEQLKVDRFEEVYNMVWYLMDKKDLAAVTGDDVDTNFTADERNKRAAVVINLKEAVCETLGKAWPVNSPKTQEKYQLMFVERCVQCLQQNTRPVQLSLLVALGKFLDRLKILDTNVTGGGVGGGGGNINSNTTNNVTAMEIDDVTTSDNNQEKKVKYDKDMNLEKICQDVLSAVVFVASIPHTGLKKEALNILLILVKKLIDKKYYDELDLVRKTFDNILIILQKDSAPEIKCRIEDIKDKFKTI